MPSKRDREGYLLVDHRESPGFTCEEATWGGLEPIAAMVGKGQKLEAPTYTCRHCQRQVIINPKRNRPHEYCSGCDHYLCERCALIRRVNGGECKPWRKVVEEYYKKNAKIIA
jgi:hypothetical protein